MAINYSKWDKLAANLSDESDNENDNLPQITKFESEKGVRIEIGPKGAHLKPKDTIKAVETRQNNAQSQEEKSRLENESDHRNGGVLSTHRWSQKPSEVIVLIAIPNDIPTKFIDVSLKDNRNITVFNRNNHSKLFDRILAYEAVVSEDSILDWEVVSRSLLSVETRTDQAIDETSGIRFIKLCLQKRVLIPGAIHWWNRCFEGDPVIDVTALADRKNATEHSKQNIDAWATAHEEFKHRIKSRELIEVDGES